MTESTSGPSEYNKSALGHVGVSASVRLQIAEAKWRTAEIRYRLAVRRAESSRGWIQAVPRTKPPMVGSSLGA